MKNKESTLVIDVETKRAFYEVGGRNNIADLGVSVAGVYDYQTDQFFALEEHELLRLEQLFCERDLVVGFNIKEFDFPVLQPYIKTLQLEDIPALDLMEEAVKIAGFRIALNNFAKHTLGEEKSGNGLEALEWLKAGRIEDVKKYCIDDVRLTRDLYEYGKREGSVKFDSRERGLVAIPAKWSGVAQEREAIRKLLKEAQEKKMLVEIDYVSSSPKDGERARKSRDIEIHAIHGGTIEAFCHLRNDKRNFRLARIMNARIKAEAHTRPTLF